MAKEDFDIAQLAASDETERWFSSWRITSNLGHTAIDHSRFHGFTRTQGRRHKRVGSASRCRVTLECVSVASMAATVRKRTVRVVAHRGTGQDRLVALRMRRLFSVANKGSEAGRCQWSLVGMPSASFLGGHTTRWNGRCETRSIKARGRAAEVSREMVGFLWRVHQGTGHVTRPHNRPPCGR